MTAGTSGYMWFMSGLASGHAYTVIDVLTINEEKVLRLRNPYGQESFSGDWSDFSSKWTKDLKLKKQYSFNKKDGEFFIGYKDFLKYFINIGFAKLHPTFTCSRLKVKKKQVTKCQLIKVTIPEDSTLVYFQLYGKNPRIPNKNGKYPKTALSNIILVDKDFNYINSIAENKMHICVESTLQKGDYYLFCDANFRYNKDMENHGYTITAYCEFKIPMENVTGKNDVPSLLRKVVIDYCKKKEEINLQKNGVNVYITKKFNKDLPYRVLTFENTSDNQNSIVVEIQCRGEKSCSFYCDEIAKEKHTKVVKNINAKETKAVIIIYHSLSSIFTFYFRIVSLHEIEDEIENIVFNEKGEIVDNSCNII